MTPIAMIVATRSVLAVMAINAYGRSLSMISIADPFRNVRPTKKPEAREPEPSILVA